MSHLSPSLPAARRRKYCCILTAFLPRTLFDILALVQLATPPRYRVLSPTEDEDEHPEGAAESQLATNAPLLSAPAAPSGDAEGAALPSPDAEAGEDAEAYAEAETDLPEPDSGDSAAMEAKESPLDSLPFTSIATALRLLTAGLTALENQVGYSSKRKKKGGQAAHCLSQRVSLSPFCEAAESVVAEALGKSCCGCRCCWCCWC